MQVEINNKDSITLPMLGHVIFGSDEICDVVLEGTADDPKKICSIILDKDVCILEVFNDEVVSLNSSQIKEMAILHPGDEIQIDKHVLKIIDDNKLPKACSTPFKIAKSQDLDDQMVTSVSGLRSFNENSIGQLKLVGSQNSYTHKPFNSSDIPFSVSYLDDKLTLLCKKNENVNINGMKANYAILTNGDYITTNIAKYCVESPGSSSFSKYSPSHPRNIQLSEEYLVGNDKPKQKSNGFIKNNLWWITLLGGLVIIAIILYFIKNN